MGTLPTIDTTFIVIVLVLFAGICIGWAARELLAPPIRDRRGELPFVRVPPSPVRSSAEILREHQRLARQRPPAPPAPRFEEDPFFAAPAERADDIEHVTGNVVPIRQMG